MYFEKIILPEEILNLHANSSEIFVKNQKKRMSLSFLYLLVHFKCERKKSRMTSSFRMYL